MYFCMLAVGVLVLDKVEEYDFECVTVYGVPLCSQGSVAYIKDVMLGRSQPSFRRNFYGRS